MAKPKAPKTPAYISQRAFAKLLGCSQPAISKAANKAGLQAATNASKWINPEHPAAIVYAKQIKVRKRKTAETKRANLSAASFIKGVQAGDTENEPSTAPVFKPLHGDRSPAEIAEYLGSLTLKQIALQFGGLPGYKAHVDALNAVTAYRDKVLKHDKERKLLVNRKAVKAAVFSLLELASTRLLGEMPQTVTLQIVPTVLSEGETAHNSVIKLLETEISNILKSCNREVINQFKQLEEE